MKIGLFFGSFNPLHYGHLQLATHFLKHSPIEEIWLVVSPQNPLKNNELSVNAHQRLEMVTLAVNEVPGLKVCDIEFSLPHPSYTIHTLEALSATYTDQSFIILLGADSLATFDKWKDYRNILESYPLLVYPRNNVRSTPFDGFPSVQWIDAPEIDISSTEIRRRIANGEPFCHLVPPAVYKYITEKRLYGFGLQR